MSISELLGAGHPYEAYQQIAAVRRRRDDVPDLRTAAYVMAIEKIANYYTEYAI